MRDDSYCCPEFPTTYMTVYDLLLLNNLMVGDLLPFTAVEKAVSELPADCQFCSQKYPRNSLERHEAELCEERWVVLLCCKTRANAAMLHKCSIFYYIYNVTCLIL